MKQKSLPCFRFTNFLKFICYSFFPLSFSPSLSFNLFSIYLVNIILHVFYIVGTNTHQPKIIDLQQFTYVDNKYYSWMWEED